MENIIQPIIANLYQVQERSSSSNSGASKPDSNKEPKVDCQKNEVGEYPILAYSRNGHKIKTYKDASNIPDVTDFVNTNKDAAAGAEANDDGEVPDAKKPEEKPSAVVRLTKENFAEKTKTGVAFVKFYASWCGHCKRLAPTWEQLAQAFKDSDNVLIGHVDCTAGDNAHRELCDSNGGNDFPILNIYKNGEKVDEYKGKRDLASLEEFVETQLSAKLEKKLLSVKADINLHSPRPDIKSISRTEKWLGYRRSVSHPIIGASNSGGKGSRQTN